MPPSSSFRGPGAVALGLIVPSPPRAASPAAAATTTPTRSPQLPSAARWSPTQVQLPPSPMPPKAALPTPTTEPTTSTTTVASSSTASTAPDTTSTTITAVTVATAGSATAEPTTATPTSTTSQVPSEANLWGAISSPSTSQPPSRSTTFTSQPTAPSTTAGTSTSSATTTAAATATTTSTVTTATTATTRPQRPPFNSQKTSDRLRESCHHRHYHQGYYCGSSTGPYSGNRGSFGASFATREGVGEALLAEKDKEAVGGTEKKMTEAGGVENSPLKSGEKIPEMSPPKEKGFVVLSRGRLSSGERNRAPSQGPSREQSTQGDRGQQRHTISVTPTPKPPIRKSIFREMDMDDPSPVSPSMISSGFLLPPPVSSLSHGGAQGHIRSSSGGSGYRPSLPSILGGGSYSPHYGYSTYSSVGGVATILPTHSSPGSASGSVSGYGSYGGGAAVPGGAGNRLSVPTLPSNTTTPVSAPTSPTGAITPRRFSVKGAYVGGGRRVVSFGIEGSPGLAGVGEATEISLPSPIEVGVVKAMAAVGPGVGGALGEMGPIGGLGDVSASGVGMSPGTVITPVQGSPTFPGAGGRPGLRPGGDGEGEKGGRRRWFGGGRPKLKSVASAPPPTLKSLGVSGKGGGKLV